MSDSKFTVVIEGMVMQPECDMYKDTWVLILNFIVHKKGYEQKPECEMCVRRIHTQLLLNNRNKQ